MIDETMLKIAEAEVERLDAELKKTPAYKRLQAARNLIAVYRADPESVLTEAPIAPVDQPGVQTAIAPAPLENEIVPATKTARVDAAAIEFLTDKGRRATSAKFFLSFGPRTLKSPAPCRPRRLLAICRGRSASITYKDSAVSAWSNGMVAVVPRQRGRRPCPLMIQSGQQLISTASCR